MNLGPLTFLRKMRSSRKEKLSPQEQQQKGIQKQLLTQKYEAMISDATFSNTFDIPSTPPPYLFDDSTKQTTGTDLRHGNNSSSGFHPESLSITRTSGHHVSRNAGHTEAMKDLRNLVEIVKVRHQERHIRILRRNSTKMISIAGCGHIVLAD